MVELECRDARFPEGRIAQNPGLPSATIALNRPVIANSWKRVALTGLCPSASVNSTDMAEFDRRSRLMVAAAPILAEMAEELADTRYVVILADRHSVLADMRCGQRALRGQLEGAGAVLGRRFTEETTGTNSIATVFELRKGLAVRGEEHYIDALKAYSCYGHPVIHPVTRRVEGVLDITCLAEDDSPLLAPFVTRYARQIGERLLAQSRVADQLILRRFQAATIKAANSAVVAVGNDIFLANSAAMQIVEAADEAVLRAVAQAHPRGENKLAFRLVTGRRFTVHIDPVPGTEAAVFTFGEEDTRAATTVRERPSRTTTLKTPISGESGSGRTSTARRIAPGSAQWLDATEIFPSGEGEWLHRLDESLEQRRGVVIEHIDLLPEHLVRPVSTLITHANTEVIMISAPPADVGTRVSELLAQCDDDIELPPLRHRRSEIPHLTASMLRTLGVASELRLTPAVLEVLSNHHWPGNLHELRAVVHRIIASGQVGDVTVADLPAPYRHLPRRSLSPIEQAERDAIVRALRSSRGNKKAAAQTLGISRTTLYKALRTYDIEAAMPAMEL